MIRRSSEQFSGCSITSSKREKSGNTEKHQRRFGNGGHKGIEMIPPTLYPKIAEALTAGYMQETGRGDCMKKTAAEQTKEMQG